MRMTTRMASVRMAMVRCIPTMHLLMVEADHRDEMDVDNDDNEYGYQKDEYGKYKKERLGLSICMLLSISI